MILFGWFGGIPGQPGTPPLLSQTGIGGILEFFGGIAMVYNIGAILGGIVFGTFSERLGRRRTIVIAALLTLPVIPLWAFSNSVVMLSIGAFLIQFLSRAPGGVT